MLMRPNKTETAVHGYHCPDDMAVRMRKVLARPWVGVRVCHLLLSVLIQCYLYLPTHRSAISADPPSQYIRWENCRASYFPTAPTSVVWSWCLKAECWAFHSTQQVRLCHADEA